MENKTIVLGDLHLQDYKPYYKASVLALDWFLKQPFNNKTNILLQEGDFFHTYNPSPRVNSLALDFVSKMKFKEKIIISGNYKHEWDAIRKTWAIDIFENIEKVKLYRNIAEVRLGNLECLILPWFSKVAFPEQGSCKQYYENLPNRYREKKYDFIFGHISPVEMFHDIVDISYLKYKKSVQGHIHKFNDKDGFIGSFQITNKEEARKENHIMIIDNESGEFEYIDVPRFIDYDDINYPEKPKATEVPIMIYDIWEAPSVDIAREHYKDLNLRKNGIHRIAVESNNSGEVVRKDRLSIKDYMNNFCKERSLPEEQRQTLIGVIER